MSFSDGGFLSEEQSKLPGHKRLWNEPKVCRDGSVVHREWSEERKAEAIFRRDVKGETNIQIARAMGVSLASVSNAFQRLLEKGAIQPVKEFWTTKEDEILQGHLEAGTTIAETAQKMGRSYSSIRNRMLVSGLERGSVNEQDEFYRKAVLASDAHVALMIKHHGSPR